MYDLRQAAAAYNNGDWHKAEQLCRRLLQDRPDYFGALNLLGAITAQTNRLGEAADLFGRAVTAQPNNAEAWSNRGVALQKLGRLTEAIENFDHAIAIQPDYAQANNNRGNALAGLKQLTAAVASYDRAITIRPDYAEAHYNRGNTLKELRRFEEAIASFDRAIATMPNCAEAYNNRGNALAELKQFAAAVQSYDRAIGIAPDFAEAYNNRGVALQEIEQLDAAITSYDRAIEILPDYAEAHYNRGNALAELKQLEAAIASYDRAIAITPDYAAAYGNRGVALQELNQLDAAVASYDLAIAIKPDDADVHNSRGNALQKLHRLDEALASYGKALQVQPDYEFLFGTLLHVKMRLCDWQDFTKDSRQLRTKIENRKKVAPSFPVLAMYDSPQLQKIAAESWVQSEFPGNDSLGLISKRNRSERIRIGYYSADFHNHATAYLMGELFEQHDKSKFEVIGFSFGPDQQDEMRIRIAAAFTRFVDVRLKSDREVARLSRELGVDIAIDLKGCTADSRTGIFAERCAPIQVSYIGYPGTMGVDYYEYLIADRTLVPVEHQKHYSEKVVYLPNSYQVNDRKRRISDRKFSKAELGLPESGFIFSCFNNSYKITPGTFDVWMRILKRVDGSVLWLLEDHPIATSNLRKAASARGVGAERLIFAPRIPLAEHLSRHRAADLFIDTLPYNAHTTASDALWTGLPVLTCAGECFASRVAASLLNAIGLPELITQDQNQYENLAVELAMNTEKLHALKHKLEINRLTMPLFDTALFTRHIESAYVKMYDRYQADLPPEPLFVEP